MANEVIPVVDPLGNTIYLLEDLCVENEEPDPEIYDTAITVIKKPAMVIETKNDHSIQHYYFRSVGWQNTILISVLLKSGKWLSDKCWRNPTYQELSDLLKTGKQIF
jgi:hypothetical protein